MKPPESRTPPGGGERKALAGDTFKANDNPLARAAVKTLISELRIILAAAHRVAGGWPLAWDDYDRLHDSHQHVLRILSVLHGKEVLQ